MAKKTVDETEDVLIAVNELALVLFRHFKDGIQLTDFPAIFMDITKDPEFKRKMFEAYKGSTSIPAEMLDIDIKEVVKLSSLQLSYIPKYLSALKERPHAY